VCRRHPETVALETVYQPFRPNLWATCLFRSSPSASFVSSNCCKPPMKTGEVLSFLGGVLTVETNGNSTLAIPEDQLLFDEKHLLVKIARSELTEIRDFLIRVLK
jgi:hypothetical protein